MEPELRVPIVSWNFLKQLTTTLGVYAACFALVDATASLACLFAATALTVALGGFALYGPGPMGSGGSCFQYVPMCAAMLSGATLAAIVIGLFWGTARW